MLRKDEASGDVEVFGLSPEQMSGSIHFKAAAGTTCTES